jgi:hypothetical protein
MLHNLVICIVEKFIRYDYIRFLGNFNFILKFVSYALLVLQYIFMYN